MKKFMKVCGILFAILLTLGIAFVTIGAMNGGWREITDRVRGEGIHFERLFPFSCAGGGIADLNVIFEEEYETVKNQKEWSWDILAGEIQNLQWNLGGCKLVTELSPDENYHIYAKNVASMQVFTKGETLHVRALQNGEWVIQTSMVITIQIPENAALETVKLELGAGEFSVEGITAENLNVEVGAGVFKGKMLKAANLHCEVGAGKAEINGEVSGNAEMEVGVGELRFTGNVAGNLTADCSMGNMVITIDGSKEADHNYSMECAMGTLTVGSHSFAGLAAEQKLDNGASSDYTLSCAMGSLQVVFK